MTPFGAPPPLLECERLRIESGPRTLIARLDLIIQAGTRWGVLGANGSGKSSLLRALAGLARPAAGNIRLAGKHYHQWTGRQAARLRSYLPQEEQGELPTTVYERVLSGRYPHLGWNGLANARDEAIVRQAIRAVDLEAVSHLDTNQLSGGESRRTAIAAILAQDTRLLLLDEPLNHLDLRHQYRLLDTLRKHVENATGAALVSLHDLNLTARFCTHVLLLDGHGGCEAGEAQEMLQPDRLGRLYGHPIAALRTRTGLRLFPE